MGGVPDWWSCKRMCHRCRFLIPVGGLDRKPPDKVRDTHTSTTSLSRHLSYRWRTDKLQAGAIPSYLPSPWLSVGLLQLPLPVGTLSLIQESVRCSDCGRYWCASCLGVSPSWRGVNGRMTPNVTTAPCTVGQSASWRCPSCKVKGGRGLMAMLLPAPPVWLDA